MRPPGIVDEDVDPPEGRQRFPHDDGGCFRRRDVRRDGERPDLTRTGVDRFRRGIEPVLVPRNEDDDGAVVDELLSDGEADAFARACDDGDPTVSPRSMDIAPSNWNLDR